MKVVVGDPGTGLVEEREFPSEELGFVEACRAFLGAEVLQSVPYGIVGGNPAEASLWVDEEGHSTPASGLWRPVGATRVLPGRFVLAGRTGDGSPAPVPVDADGAAGGVEMWGARVTVDPADPTTGTAEHGLVRTR